MKNHDFQELVDRNLSELVWDERKRRKVLLAVSEEEKPVKRISKTFILATAVAVCLGVTALASGLVFSGRVDAARLAERALYEEYGITAEMLDFFVRTNEEKNVVRYDGCSPMAYVLGSYTVTVENGRADASWSWDGEDLSAGFDGRAWGAAQLDEICREARHSLDSEAYMRKARAVAAANGASVASPDGPALTNAEQKALQEKQREDAEKAKAAAKLTVPEMEAIAREAVALRYEFDEEQTARLKVWNEEIRYGLVEGAPCCRFWLSLGYMEDGYTGGKGTGTYDVAVNVENGTVEDMWYNSDLGGAG